MSKSPLKTLLVAKFMFILGCATVGLTLSKCEPRQPSVVESTSLRDSLREDSIVQLKISQIQPSDFISPNGYKEGSDEWIIELIQFNNPHLTYVEAEELFLKWNSEGVN